MEVLETPTNNLPGCSSPAQEPSKTLDPDAKIFKEGSRTSSAEISRGNGIRVSTSRKDALHGDLGRGVVEVVRGKAVVAEVSVERDFGDQNFVSSNDNAGGLEDSEMNGVTSLLKMRKDEPFQRIGSVLNVIDEDGERGFESGAGVKTRRDPGVGMNGVGYPDRKTGRTSESEDSEGEGDMENEGHAFDVGDFVWGKIRSYPWWPGRIYDPSDASEYAKKLKRGDKILVAYFGDDTFAWCNPFQLKPFEDNFVEMSKQSSSKNFVNAVEEAVDEVGRLVDLKMTCTCVPKENLIGFGRSLSNNAGIKEGLLVPEDGTTKFSRYLFEPAQLLSLLKGMAQLATSSNMLEFSILKNWLSAFFRTKGGNQLPSCYEPQPIPGLEDDAKNWVLDLNLCNGGVEGTFQGPVEEEWLSSPSGPKFGQTHQSLLQKCQGVLYERRKHKSIAEIMESHANAEAENENKKAEQETKSSKSASLAERNKEKGRGDTCAEGRSKLRDSDKGAKLGNSAAPSGGEKKEVSDKTNAEDKNKTGDVAKSEFNLYVLQSLSGRKKRKVCDEADGKSKSKVGDVAKALTNSGKPASSLGGKKRKGIDEAYVDGGNDSISKPTRKKETTLSESPAASENKVSSPKVDCTAVKKESYRNSSSGRRNKKAISSGEIDGGNGKSEETMVPLEKKMGGSSILSDPVEATEQIEKVISSRERKKSKYLSPPYTNLNAGQRNREMEAEYFKKLSEETDAGIETPDDTCAQTPKQTQENIINPEKVKAPTIVLLSQIRSAALDPLYLKKSNNLKTVEEFFSVLRDSIYCNGLYYKMYNCPPGRKRKSQESETGPLLKEQNKPEHSSTDYKSQQKKTKKSGDAKSDKPKSKQAAVSKTNDKEPNRKDPAAALFVTFGPGSSLPSKNDLLRKYGKFGDLDTEETEMFYNNYCARIVFWNTSEAEEAFNDSQLANPFGSASVTFRLQYLAADTKTRELKEVLDPKPTSMVEEGVENQHKTSASQSSDSDASQLKYIRRKLEMMTSMLDISDGKMSSNMKSKLQGEMKGLLEKVSTMVASSS